MKFNIHPNNMLTNKDYIDSSKTLNVIAQLKDDPGSRLSFQELLTIFEFILVGVKTIFFNNKGKPKSMIQLAMSIPAIIQFIRDVVRMINGGVKRKETIRVKAK